MALGARGLCSSAEELPSVSWVRLETLLGNPVNDFFAYESDVRLDAYIGDKPFLYVSVDCLYVDPEDVFKVPGREHVRHSCRTGRVAEVPYSTAVAISGDTMPLDAEKMGS